MSNTWVAWRMGQASRPTRGKLAFLAGALLLGAVAYWWFDGGRYAFVPRRLGVVVEGRVYRSAQLHPRLIRDVLERRSIRHVIDLAEDPPGDAHAAAELAVARELGITHQVLPGLQGDGRGDPSAYVKTLQAMHHAAQDGPPLLVHCAAGTQRTGAATMLYRTLFQGWSGERAFAEYLAYRGGRRDDGVLPQWLDRNLPGIVEALVKAGALARAPETLPTFTP